MLMAPIIEGGDVVESLSERVLGRVVIGDVLNAFNLNITNRNLSRCSTTNMESTHS
jgi:hypothetical protein